MKTSKTIREIPLSQIKLGENYRTPENIESLAISITSEGQMVPVHVIKDRENFVILNGFRRYAAIIFANEKLKAEIDTIKSIVVEENFSEEERELKQLLLNETHQSPLERAIKISELIEKGMKQKKIAEAFGMKEASVSMIKRKFVPNELFNSYVRNRIIIRLDDKNKNKIIYSSDIKKIQDYIGNEVELLKYVTKISPGEDKVSLTSLDMISEVYYKLSELNKIEIFEDMIVKLQNKKIYDRKGIESVCKNILKSLGAEKIKKNTGFERVLIAQKILGIFEKIKIIDADTIAEINKTLTEKKIPVEIKYKN